MVLLGLHVSKHTKLDFLGQPFLDPLPVVATAGRWCFLWPFSTQGNLSFFVYLVFFAFCMSVFACFRAPWPSSLAPCSFVLRLCMAPKALVRTWFLAVVKVASLMQRPAWSFFLQLLPTLCGHVARPWLWSSRFAHDHHIIGCRYPWAHLRNVYISITLFKNHIHTPRCAFFFPSTSFCPSPNHLPDLSDGSRLSAPKAPSSGSPCAAWAAAGCSPEWRAWGQQVEFLLVGC